MPQETSTRLNLAYLTSRFGILKIIEFICSLLAFSLCASFRDSWGAGGFSGTSSRIGFFIFVAVVSWLFALVMIILNVTSLISKINFQWKTICLAIIHGVAAVLFLIASSLCADNARKWYDNKLLCDFLDAATTTTCETYAASVTCVRLVNGIDSLTVTTNSTGLLLEQRQNLFHRLIIRKNFASKCHSPKLMRDVMEMVFGFVCLVVFAIDAVFHLMAHSKGGDSGQASTATA